MIIRRKRQYPPSLGLRMASSSRDRIARYMPSAVQNALPVVRQPVMINRASQAQPASVNQPLFAGSPISESQSQDTRPSSSPDEWFSDLEHILQLHQEQEKSQAMDVNNNASHFQPVDLADALSLREKETKPDPKIEYMPPYRPARIQEVTPKQSATMAASEKEPLVRTVSNLNNEVNRKPAIDNPEKADGEDSSEADNHISDTLPLVRSENELRRTLPPPDLDLEDTSQFEIISDEDEFESIEESRSVVSQNDREIAPPSNQLDQVLISSESNASSHEVSTKSIDNLPETEIRDAAPVALNREDPPSIVQFEKDDIPATEETGSSFTIGQEQLNTTPIREAEGDPDSLIERKNHISDNAATDVGALVQPFEPSVGIDILHEGKPNKNEITSNLEHNVNVFEFTPNKPENSAVAAPLPNPTESLETHSLQSTAKTQPSDNIASEIQRQEIDKSEISRPLSPNAELLKLLNLPPETPIIGLETADGQPELTMTSPVQVSTSINSDSPEISRTTIDSVLETGFSQAQVKSAENSLPEVKIDTAKPNINTEKLARRVFELIKDRLNREFERRFDNSNF